MSAAIAREVPLAAQASMTDGGTAVLQLDAAMVRARAEQQGLDDRSIRAAAASRRVQATVLQAMAKFDVRSCILVDESGTEVARVHLEDPPSADRVVPADDPPSVVRP